MAHPESTHDVAVKTETTKTTVETESKGDEAPEIKDVSKHRVDEEGQPKQVLPDGR